VATGFGCAIMPFHCVHGIIGKNFCGKVNTP
jgi:hypothetical protein